MIQSTSSETFLDRLRRNQRPVVLDIWATWCVPCRAIEPAIDRLSQEYDGQVDVGHSI
jgi:thioredoxin 1